MAARLRLAEPSMTVSPSTSGGGAPPPHANFLAGLLESTSLVIYLKDIAGRYIYVNRRYEALAGVSRDLLLGKTDDDFFPPDVAKLFREQDAQVVARRGLIEFEETVPLPGGVCSFLTEKFPLFDEHGDVYAVGGFCTEITSQKSRADESLAEERERLAVTVRSLGEGVIATDKAGRVTLLNRAAELLTSTTQSDAVGRTVDEVLLAGELAHEGAFGVMVRDALAGKQRPPVAEEAVVFSAKGVEHTVIPSASAVRDRGGDVIGAVLCLRDVTAQRQADAERAQIRRLESIGSLAGGLAHDFNNLLTGVVGNLGLLVDDPAIHGPARETLEAATRACRKATALSRQLLTFASGGVLARRPLALAPLLADSARLVLQGSNVSSHQELPADLRLVEGDDAQLRQVFVNLLTNAREAMPDGGTVWIRGENVALAEPMLELPAGRYVRLTVTDDGRGISADALPRIFDPYFSSNEPGRGLGLAIVHSVVRRHGGHIWAQSAEGEGTSFFLMLPATDKRLVAEPEGIGACPGRVLVMDDEEVVIQVAESILQRAGYSVVVARDGAAAVAAYSGALDSGEPFDAVILDVAVRGGMGGREAAAEIRAVDPAANIIFSSGGYATAGDADAELALSPMLQKPYTRGQFVGAVAASIRSRRHP